MNVVPEHPSRIARIGSVLALVGALVWVQWPLDLASFSIAAVLAFIGALTAWISVELADYRESERFFDNVMSEDVDKLNSLLKIIDRNQFYVLKRQAIQAYMDSDAFRGIQKLIDHKDNDIFPFHSNNIQSLYEKFSKDAHDFILKYYSLYSYDGNDRSTWRPPGGGYVSNEIYKVIQDEIAVLNEEASKLAELWEELIGVSRRELRGASRTIDRYEM